jgi:anti-sigma factor RsiW
MAPDDRDRTFEKALSRHFHPGASQPVCPDAEVLAAYHDHLLSPEQMLAIEQHLASCPRCPEILAQLAATEDLPVEDLPVDDVLAGTGLHENASQSVLTMPAPHEGPELVSALSGSALGDPVSLPSRAARVAQSGWRSRTLRGPNWRYLAPAGLIAAVLLLWVALHESRPPAFQLAKNSQQPSALPSTQTPSAQSSAGMRERMEEKKEVENYVAAPPPSPATRSSSAAVDDLVSREAKKSDQTAILDKAPFSSRSMSSLSTLSPAIAGSAQKKPVAPAPASVPVPSIDSSTSARVASEPGSDVSATVQHDSKKQQVEAPQVFNEVQRKELPANESSATVPQPLDEQSAKAKSENARGVTQTQQLRAQANTVTQSVEVQSLQTLPMVQLAKSIAPNTVSSPDSSIQWRFSSAGLIEHSTNAGATWSIQPSNVIADLLAASAPSTKVCWIVGRDATILRTTDAGAHWTKLPAPAQSDLIGIFAVNKNQATVTTTNHQTYTTKDAAKTWTPAPNP